MRDLSQGRYCLFAFTIAILLGWAGVASAQVTQGSASEPATVVTVKAPSPPAVPPAPFPKWIGLEVGTVRVTPCRPGTGTVAIPCRPWDTPVTSSKRKPDLCEVAGAIPGWGKILGKSCSLLGLGGSEEKKQTHDATAPDLFVRLEATGRRNVGYRTYTARRVIFHTFRERIIIPYDGIPTSGLRVLVMDDDGEEGADAETIGSILLTRDEILSAARGATLRQADGGVEKLELAFFIIEESPPPARNVTLKVRDGLASFDPPLEVYAGQVVEIQSGGRYQVSDQEGQEIGPDGDPASETPGIEIASLSKAKFGQTIASVGMERTITIIPLGACARFVAPNSGLVTVGVNDRDPRNNRGQVRFVARVSNPSVEEWNQASLGSPCVSRDNVVPDPGVDEDQKWNEQVALGIKTAFEGASAETLGQRLLMLTHPSGNSPAIAGVEVDTSRATVFVKIKLNWSGGVLGQRYSTVIGWRFNRQAHVAATVESDNAFFSVDDEHRQRLSTFFADLHRKLLSTLRN